MSRWCPVDIIIFILTITICFLVLVHVYAVLIKGNNVNEDQGQRTLTFILALVSLINAYVVSKVTRGRDT